MWMRSVFLWVENHSRGGHCFVREDYVRYDEGYWPTAAEQPGATKHDIEHSRWYRDVDKIVLSRTKQNNGAGKVRFIAENISREINERKQSGGKNIIMFGSPSAIHSLLRERLIDEFWLFENPIVLGNGIPLFKGIDEPQELRLLTTKTFLSGVNAVHYGFVRK